MPINMLGFACALVALFIIVEVSHKPLLALFLKGLASFGFILVLLTVLWENQQEVCNLFCWIGDPLEFTASQMHMAFLILGGLVCGLLGDLFLGLRPLRPKEEEPKIILGGVVAFSIGHIFYYVMLLWWGVFSPWALVFSVAVTVLIYLAAGWMKMDWEKSKIPCTLYSFLIFTMVGQSFANAMAEGFDPFSTVLFIGAILFAISDLILSQIYFKGQNENKVFVIANLTTYYAAQLLLAFSMFLI